MNTIVLLKQEFNVTDIIFSSDGTPFSQQFNDIYFDSEHGYQQSREVFIDGNDIPNRLHQVLQQRLNDAESAPFTIAETGFGTGLNFLLTLQAYQQVRRQLTSAMPASKRPVWQFISVEKYPLSRAQLQQALAIFPEFHDFSQQLCAQYPTDTDTIENNSASLQFFDGEVTLTLLFADACDGFSSLKVPKHGLVDAWYLDGFSPAKNPDMWRAQVLQQLARLAKAQATIATFTVAGFVRRGLQAVGFRVAKTPSQGQKQDILTGKYQLPPNDGKGYRQRPLGAKPQHVTMIGGGIASACAALALTERGIKVRLYCRDDIAQGASSNAIGALYPLLHQQQDNISRFYQQAFLYAKQFYQRLLQQGYHFDHAWCGLLEVAHNNALKLRLQQFTQLQSWPESLIQVVDQQTAEQIANLPLAHGGLYMPQSGWIAPQQLVKQLFAAASNSGRLKIHTGVNITRIEQSGDNGWKLHSNKGVQQCQTLILCGGAEQLTLNYLDSLPLYPVRGQVTAMRGNDAVARLKTVLCHKGYLTPENQGVHCIGATFEKHSRDIDSRSEDDHYNLNMLAKCLPATAAAIDWQANDIATSKARLRCASPDHFPVVGPMPDIRAHIASYPHLASDKNWRYDTPAPYLDNLYLLSGLGARGLCSAPLLAQILAADLCGTPYPVDDDMLFNLSANRFIIKDIIKRKVAV